MAVDHLDLACSGCTGSPHSRIHLISIEFPALFVEGFACRNLVPGLDARNTFHVTKDNDMHTIPPFTWYPQNFFFPAYTYPGRIPTQFFHLLQFSFLWPSFRFSGPIFYDGRLKLPVKPFAYFPAKIGAENGPDKGKKGSRNTSVGDSIGMYEEYHCTRDKGAQANNAE